jgi:hypothetical protein
MARLEDLEFRITANMGELTTALNSGSAQVKRFADRTANDFSRFGRGVGIGLDALRSALAAFGIALGARSILNFARNAIETADAIGETAKAAGLGAERFQRLQFVFEQNGVEAESFGLAMRTLNVRLGQFQTTGAGPAAEALKDLGLAQDVANGKIRTADDLMTALIRKFGQVEGTAKAAALGAALFGRGVGVEMVPALLRGADAMESAAAAAKGIFTDDQVRAADEINDKFNELSQTIGVTFKGAVLDALEGWRQFFGPTEVEAAKKRMGQLNTLIQENNAEIERIGRSTPRFFGGLFAALGHAEIDHRTEQVAKYTKELDALWEVVKRAAGIDNTRPTGAELLDGDTAASKGQKHSPELRAVISQLEMAEKLTEAMATDFERQAEAMREAKFLLDDQRITLETYNRLRDSFLKPILVDARRMEDPAVARRTKELADAAEEAKRKSEQFGIALASAFESRGIEALMNGDIRAGIRGFAQDLAELVIRIAVLQPLAERLAATFSNMGSGSKGGVLASLAGMFGGGGGGGGGDPLAGIETFGSGGPMSAGQMGIVGDRGPELWVPNVAGRILTGSQARGMGGGTTVVQNFYTQAGLPPQWEVQLAGVASLAAGAALDAVNSRGPGGRR